MRFITMVKSAEGSGPPPPEVMEAIGRLGAEATQAGVLVETGGLAPTGARVRLSGGEITVTDGPFAEAKEVIGGYAIFEVPSLNDAIEEAKRFMEVHRQHWNGWEGETEVRQIIAPGDGPPTS
jgi:hypothetical protein